jgi:RNA polymerase sigma-70 factor, ECF subfamily
LSAAGLKRFLGPRDFVTDENVNPSGGVDDTSLSLLDRVKAREEAAWCRLNDLYSPLIRHWLARSCFQAADQDDLIQEVLTAVERHIGTFERGGANSFRGWLRTITRSKISDFVRKHPRQATGIGGSDALAIFDQTPQSDETSGEELAEEKRILYLRAVALLRDEFKESTWKAFWKAAIEDCSVNEVAKELGLTPNAVYLAKSRVLRRLRMEFVDLIED